MWDNTDKQDEGYTDYLTDTGFFIAGVCALGTLTFIGWLLW